MRWPWMIALWAAAVPVVVIVAVGWARRHQQRGMAVALAHTLRLAGTERFAVLRRRQVVVTAARTLFAAVAILGVVGITARPTSSQTIDTDRPSRDVLLCLDVSGSMDEANIEILQTFIDVARSLEGDRIGLVIFNTVAVPKFPLTDDLDYVLAELERGALAIETFDFTWARATFPPGSDNSSLLADGLASCTQRFDRLDEDRPRSIVFATDNDPQGAQVFTLSDAVRLAADAGIRVYGINPDRTSPSFEDLVEQTGGRYWQGDDMGLVDEIVGDILAQEAARLDDEASDVVVSDQPQAWIALAVVGTLGLVGVSRGQRR